MSTSAVIETAISYTIQTLSYFFKAYLIFLVVAPITAVYQEAKIWANPNLPSLSIFGMIKVYLLNLIWMVTTTIASLILLPKVILRMDVERDAHCLMERLSAIFCTILVVGPVQIRNAHNLPPDNTACIYIANHASQIDLAVVYFIFRRFKWISKKSVTYLPGVGTLMAMSGHVFIERNKSKDKSHTVKQMYNQAKINLSNNIPMFIFPQGTRRWGQRLPFKYGAFNMATDNQVPIVPISIDIPNQVWNDAYPLNILWTKKDPIVLTVHQPILVTKDTDKEKLMNDCDNIIYSVLPDFSKQS